MSNAAQDQKLHQDVAAQLTRLGHPPSTVPVTAETPFPLTAELKNLGVDASHIMGSSWEDLMGGSTRIRETSSRGPLKIFKDRLKKAA